jgi:hypothetical protein
MNNYDDGGDKNSIHVLMCLNIDRKKKFQLQASTKRYKIYNRYSKIHVIHEHTKLHVL